MFSVNSTVPQVATALAQIPALLNHLRSSNFSKTLSTSSHVPQPNRKDRHARYKTHTAQTVEELIAICNDCLNANSIKIVPQHVNKTELLSVCRNNPLRRSFLGLRTSHTSTPTFFENKTGFPESVLRSPILGQIHLQHLLSPASNSFRLEQRRGFETNKKRQETANKEKESKMDTEDNWKNASKKVSPYLRIVAVFVSLYLLLRIYLATSNGFLMGDFGPKPVKTNTTFDDVQGCYEAKQELIDIVNFLKQPLRFTSVGAKLPKGVLLSGPPGVGKTLLARAVAGEANVPFFQVAGSEFDEVFVGTGAKKIRTLFKVAKSVSPCVIFIDELDSVASTRSNSGMHPYANQTINQLLAEMDGFEPNCGVIVIGATNKSQVLDSAIVRAGRFDVEINVRVPPYRERVELFSYFLKKPNITIHNDVIVEDLASNTVGFTGADVENMINQAAIHAALRNSAIICQQDLEYSREKIQMGPAMKHKIPDENTNRMTAYHEAGHTLVTLFTQNSRPLYKVTIQARGQSLGHTAFSMEKDQYSTSKEELLANMDVAMGGRVAEELVFGSDKVGTGATADFQQATAIARSMVEKCGMSEKVGTIVFSDSLKPSGAMQDLIDKEVQRLLNESYARAMDLLKKHRDDLNRLAAALLKYEVLSKEDVEAVIAGRKPKAALPSKPRTQSIVETIIFKDKPGQTN
ncbi:ATP-dependent zinc metalloprotease YME1 homolog [Mizuhopecten yessoensis]|uniref:ATP-dependent zinc metalloprotease YME1L1 n=1 Tax=Mizuhopecten yessoensis TaxID=6573 RepID=A0A210QBE8_MIZYE|nr:ATP-dependent zinc metalloprotease YME1 homolog [Mizuhopecten yessoensis]OWF46060.1 ATP-dependent zinc metalloprotease YME1L1 [Mizuhopecten yessoensis]